MTLRGAPPIDSAVWPRNGAVRLTGTLPVTFNAVSGPPERKLLLTVLEKSHVMSTQRYLTGELLRKGRANQSSSARWDVSIDVSIDAEPRSVFYAWTMPEYLETWLRPPGCRAASVIEKPSGFSIQFSGDDLVLVDVSWNISRVDQMEMIWNVEGNTSAVSIRLQPGTGRTILHLRHRCLASVESSIWHGHLWTSSLERLATLIEHPGAAENHGRARIRAISSLHRGGVAGQLHTSLQAAGQHCTGSDGADSRRLRA